METGQKGNNTTRIRKPTNYIGGNILTIKMSDQNSSSDVQLSTHTKAKVSRWFKSVMNIVRSKAKGDSKGFVKIGLVESSTDITADSSCLVNVTYDSATDPIAQLSSTTNSVVTSSGIRSSSTDQLEPSRYYWNQPSTSCSSSFYKQNEAQKQDTDQDSSDDSSDVPSFIDFRRNSVCESSTQKEVSRPMPSHYRGFGSKKFNSETQPKVDSSSDSVKFKYYQPSHANSKSDSRINNLNKRSFLIANEKTDSWSLHYGEVSPKVLDDSFELIEGELYEPIKRIRMDYGDDANPEPNETSKDPDVEKEEEETQSEKQEKRFGLLTFEELPEPHDMKSCPFKELEKFFCQSRKLVREIYGNLITIKDWTDFLRDKQFLEKNLEKLLESFQSMKNLLNPTVDSCN